MNQVRLPFKNYNVILACTNYGIERYKKMYKHTKVININIKYITIMNIFSKKTKFMQITNYTGKNTAAW